MNGKKWIIPCNKIVSNFRCKCDENELNKKKLAYAYEKPKPLKSLCEPQNLKMQGFSSAFKQSTTDDEETERIETVI